MADSVLFLDQTAGHQHDEVDLNVYGGDLDALLSSWGLASYTGYSDAAFQEELFHQTSGSVSFSLKEGDDTGLKSLDGDPIRLSEGVTSNGVTYFKGVVDGGAADGAVAFLLVYVPVRTNGEVTGYTLYTFLYNEAAPIWHDTASNHNELATMSALVEATLTTDLQFVYTDFSGIPAGQQAFGVLTEPTLNPDPSPDSSNDVVITSKVYDSKTKQWLDSTINTSNVAGSASAIGVGSQSVNTNEVVIYDFVADASYLDSKNIDTLTYNGAVRVNRAFSTVTQLNPNNANTRADVKVWLRTGDPGAVSFDGNDNIGIKVVYLYLNGNYETPAYTITSSAGDWTDPHGLGLSVQFINSDHDPAYEYAVIKGLKAGDRFEVEGDEQFDRMVVGNAGSGNRSFDLGVTGYSIDGSEATSVLLGGFGLYDDGPTAALSGLAVTGLKLDESPLAPNGDGLRTTSATFGDLHFNSSHGADKAGSVAYALHLTASDVNSGLFALDPTATDGKGLEILLTLSGDTVTGKVGAIEYFTITVNPNTGVITFTQHANIWHGIASNHDDSASLDLTAGTLILRQTIVDGDGDYDSVDLDLSQGVFSIEDDGPKASLKAGVTITPLTLDESPLPTAGDGVWTASHQFGSSYFKTPDYGTDGAGSLAYALILSNQGSLSGLFALDPANNTDGKGLEILLTLSGDTVTGKVGDIVYFTITVDQKTGEITFTRLQNIWHAVSANPDDEAKLITSPNNLVLRQIVHDADRDQAMADLDLSNGVFVIEDDGPTFSTASVTLSSPEGSGIAIAVPAGHDLDWNPGTDGFRSLVLANLVGTATGGNGNGSFSHEVKSVSADSITIDVSYGGQKIATHVFNATAADSFTTWDYQGNVLIEPTDLEAGAAVKAGGPHPLEFRLFPDPPYLANLAVMVTGGTRTSGQDETHPFTAGQLNTSAQGYAAGNTNQNLEFGEAIKFTFTEYGDYDYDQLATNAANSFKAGTYSDPVLDVDIGAYSPVGGFGFDITKLTGGAKVADFIAKATFSLEGDTTQDVYFQFDDVGVGKKDNPKVFVGYDMVTGWTAYTWKDANGDSLLDAGEALNGRVNLLTPLPGDQITGLAAVEIYNNDVDGNTDTFNVTNPRFYSLGAQTEIVPEFKYSFDLLLTDNDFDRTQTSISATIEGSGFGATLATNPLLALS